MASRKGALAQTDRLWLGCGPDSTQILALSTLRIGLNRLAISLQQFRHLAARSERFEASSSPCIFVQASVITTWSPETRLSHWAMTSSKTDETGEIRLVGNQSVPATFDA
jgi:hypothetical protein